MDAVQPAVARIAPMPPRHLSEINSAAKDALRCGSQVNNPVGVSPAAVAEVLAYLQQQFNITVRQTEDTPTADSPENMTSHVRVLVEGNTAGLPDSMLTLIANFKGPTTDPRAFDRSSCLLCASRRLSAAADSQGSRPFVLVGGNLVGFPKSLPGSLGHMMIEYDQQFLCVRDKSEVIWRDTQIYSSNYISVGVRRKAGQQPFQMTADLQRLAHSATVPFYLARRWLALHNMPEDIRSTILKCTTPVLEVSDALMVGRARMNAPAGIVKAVNKHKRRRC